MKATLAIFMPLLLVPHCRAERPRPVMSGAAWAIDDVLAAESASDLQASPDGRFAVWLKSLPDKDKGERVSRLMRTDLTSGQDVPLVRTGDSCESPRWSPDGKRVAFLRARQARPGHADEDETKAQLWLIDPTGGEAWPLTESDRGVRQFAWAGPEAIVFSAQESPAHDEVRRKDDKDDTIVVEDEAHEPPVRLFRIDIGTSKVKRLTENADRIEHFAVSPDGRYAIALHNRSLRWTYDNRIKPQARLHDLRDSTSKRVLADPKLNISHFRWALDGSGFYAVNERNSQPHLAQAGVPELYFHDLGRQGADRIDLGWERGLALQALNEDSPGFAATSDGFVALLADGTHNRLARYRRGAAGWKREWLTGDHVSQVFGLQISPDGKLVLYCRSTASMPPQWYAARLDGAQVEGARKIASVEASPARLPCARTEVMCWRGANGDEVEGILYYPLDHRPGEPRPLVVMIHGGPASVDQDAWDESWGYAPNLYCGRGAFVLRPNYHGSSNYGLKWLESITRGRYGEPELTDIEKGVDEVIRRGLADPERLGLVGWSNGAILANLLTARTTRYKAAAAGAGSVEFVSDWANCDFGDAFDRYYFGGSPLDEPRWYEQRSPFWKLASVQTPTLIFFGTEDRTVPTEQGWVHYRGLQQASKAPVRFVLFPGEKHSLKKLAHQRRKLVEERAWLDRYLFRPEKVVKEPLKAGSPLASALALKAAKRDGNFYGMRIKGQLVPETVALGHLRVGRFEVTRAQFAAFDRDQKIEPGKENFPATGISFEQARAYCEWLSRLTGEPYRLPTETEADELYRGDSAGENTLDYWAAYTANPDDAAQLREKAAALGVPAPLLREVGSFRGQGKEELVFDLGGNVAEWVLGKDGKGQVRGGSADQPGDARRSTVAAPAYRGLRVVRAAR